MLVSHRDGGFLVTREEVEDATEEIERDLVGFTGVPSVRMEAEGDRQLRVAARPLSFARFRGGLKRFLWKGSGCQPGIRFCR